MIRNDDCNPTNHCENPKSRPKHHGCSKSPDIMQILSYVIIVGNTSAIIFFAFFATSSIYLKIFGFLFYTFVTSLLLYYGILCTFSDITEERQEADKRRTQSQRDKKKKPVYYYCEYCKRNVTETSKHCKTCDRCVTDFDHHCRWLNNCIGKQNYRIFMNLIKSTLLYLLSCSLLLALFSSFAQVDTTYVILGSSLAVFDFLTGVLLFRLYCFHLWIEKMGITTYDYLMQKRAGAKETPDGDKKRGRVKPKGGIVRFKRKGKIPGVDNTSVKERSGEDEEVKVKSFDQEKKQLNRPRDGARLPAIRNNGGFS